MNFKSFLSVADWITTSFPIIRIIMIIALVCISVIISIIVLIQPSGESGMGAIAGQSSDTYYQKNKGRNIEGVLKRLTIVLGITSAAISILFFITLVIYPAF